MKIPKLITIVSIVNAVSSAILIVYNAYKEAKDEE